MTAHMVAVHRRYTKAEKEAYRARVAKRRGPRVWLNGVDISDMLSDFKLEPWQSHVLDTYFKQPVKRRHHFGDRMGFRVPTIIPRGGVL
jgi:hypothetical protein